LMKRFEETMSTRKVDSYDVCACSKLDFKRCLVCRVSDTYVTCNPGVKVKAVMQAVMSP
jgi:hypothetical protein